MHAYYKKTVRVQIFMLYFLELLLVKEDWDV